MGRGSFHGVPMNGRLGREEWNAGLLVVSPWTADVERSGRWLACERLVQDAGHLAAVVAGTRQARGTDRDDVATSLFVQGYAFRIATVAVGSWLLHDAVVDVAPSTTAIALGRGRPNAVDLTASTNVVAPVGQYTPSPCSSPR